MMSVSSSVRFIETEMEILLSDRTVAVQGWAGPDGISRLRFPMGLPGALKGQNSPLKVRVGKITADVVLMQHHGPGGLSHGARFLSLSGEQREYLEKRLESEGKNPFWSRRHIRLEPKKLLSTHNFPQKVSLQWVGKEQSLEVMNFSLEGLRLKWMGIPDSLRIGTVLGLNIYTSKGERLPRMDAEIRNYTRATPIGEESHTELGLQFQDLHRVASSPYGFLLRELALASAQKP